jgi:Centriolar protein SAS N-terminal
VISSILNQVALHGTLHVLKYRYLFGDFFQFESGYIAVDFAAFPSMLVQLLEKCRHVDGASPPRFILVLNCTAGGHQACLEFTELNQFKHLCHLSLILVKASDVELKVNDVINIYFPKSDVESLTETCYVKFWILVLVLIIYTRSEVSY